MGQFFKMFPNLSQNWLNFKTILEKSGDLLKIGIWMGHFFEKLVFVWVYF